MKLVLKARAANETRTWQAPLIGILAGLIAGGILIALAGANPFKAYLILLDAAFVGRLSLTETLAKAAPLLFSGLAAIVAFRARFWNIGAEGQILLGAMAAAFIGTLTSVPGSLLVPGMIAGSAAAGALGAGFAAILKTRLKVDEVVSTLMLNFIILYCTMALLDGPWKDPVTHWPNSPSIRPEAEFPVLLRATHLHLGVLLAGLAAAGLALLLQRSVFGYEVDVVGENPRAALHAGISPVKIVVVAALISGGFAGLAGAGEVGAIQFKMIASISAGYGYAGLIVAMLARLNPLAAIGSAIFLAALITGSDEMARQTGVPVFVSDAIQGITLIAVLVAMACVKHRISIVFGRTELVR